MISITDTIISTGASTITVVYVRLCVYVLVCWHLTTILLRVVLVVVVILLLVLHLRGVCYSVSIRYNCT